MPKNVLPDAARVLPKPAQTVWLKAFNEALDKGLSESESSKMGWAAVKRAGYSKSGKKWSKSMDMNYLNEHDFVMHDDGTFELGLPLMKVNVEKRIVEGFATLDNVDQVGDKVSLDASVDAFSNWFGNIREMHGPNAVGKAIDYTPDTYVDENTGETYEGIWVKARISKGAEDTWQKVLDGTLAGFSIGGVTLEKSRDIHKAADGSKQSIWNITKYKLSELSLVDSPCNRLATISLIKSVDGASHIEDVVDDGALEKAHNLESGEFVDLSGDLVGIVSSLERYRDAAIANKADRTASYASDLLATMRRRLRSEKEEAEYYANMRKDDHIPTKEEAMTKVDESSNQDLQENDNSDININTSILSDEEKTVFRKFIDFIKGDADASADEETLEKSEENEKEASEPNMNEEQVTKAIDEAVSGVNETLTKSVDDKFEEIAKSFEAIKEIMEKAATADSLDEIKKSVDDKINSLVERVEAVEAGGAVKKSDEDAGDADGEELKKSEGLWSGDILPDFIAKKGA